MCGLPVFRGARGAEKGVSACHNKPQSWGFSSGLFHSSGGWESGVKVLGLVAGEDVFFLACGWLSSRCVLTRPDLTWALISSWGPISKRHHLGMRASVYECWGRSSVQSSGTQERVGCLGLAGARRPPSTEPSDTLSRTPGQTFSDADNVIQCRTT